MPRHARLRAWLARHALGLWFLAIAGLGLVRWWMQAHRDGAAADAPDAIAWLAGSLLMGAIACVTLWRNR